MSCLMFWENSRSQNRSSIPLDHAIPTPPKKGFLDARYFNRFQTFTGGIFSPGPECRKDAVGMVLADTGKTTQDWKPMASFQHGAHAGFFAMLFSPGVFSSLQK